MKAKSWLFFVILIGLAGFLTVNFVGWLPILTFFGCRIVEPEYAISDYEGKVSPILDEWKGVINDWEESPTQLKADTFYHEMQNLITSWDNINPPEEFKDYHFWMCKAMEYEAEAFRVIADCSPDKLDDVRNLAVQLWVLKDQALLKAEASDNPGAQEQNK